MKPATSLAKLEHVSVSGWTLLAEDGELWLRDLDLGERAGLARPRGIRRVIEKLIREGKAALAGGRVGGAAVRAERVLVPQGSFGATQEVTEYLLNRKAVVLVLMRLRTPVAVDLQIVIADVFVAAMQGRSNATVPSPSAELMGRLEESVASLSRQLSALTAKVDAAVVRGAPRKPPARRRRSMTPAIDAPAHEFFSRTLHRMLDRERHTYVRCPPRLCPCGESLHVSRLGAWDRTTLTARCQAGHQAAGEVLNEPPR